MNAKLILTWLLRMAILTVLYFPLWILGTLVIGSQMPDFASEPGIFSDSTGILLFGFLNILLIVTLIVSSRWRGWRLALVLALAYYGSFTLVTQIETWYFLTDISVSPSLLPRLFIMGLSIPLLYIPLAIFVCNRWKQNPIEPVMAFDKISFKHTTVKLMAIAPIYLIIYWLAGYYIAWQNPELRAFYGSPGEIAPFWSHTIETLSKKPDLALLQLFRGGLFALLVLPMIWGSRTRTFTTGFIVASLLAIPHLGHILPNPIIPSASVRLSHMIETASSTFLFGLIIVWLWRQNIKNHSNLFDSKNSN